MKQPPPPGGAGFCKDSGQRLRLSLSLSRQLRSSFSILQRRRWREGGAAEAAWCMEERAEARKPRLPERGPWRKTPSRTCAFFCLLLSSLPGPAADCVASGKPEGSHRLLGGGGAGEALVMLAFCSAAELAAGGWVGGWKEGGRSCFVCVGCWVVGVALAVAPVLSSSTAQHLWEGKNQKRMSQSLCVRAALMAMGTLLCHFLGLASFSCQEGKTFWWPRSFVIRSRLGLQPYLFTFPLRGVNGRCIGYLGSAVALLTNSFGVLMCQCTQRGHCERISV